MVRRLANGKRVDLSDIADGWDGCYAVVTPATVDEYMEFSKIDTSEMTNAEAIERSVSFVTPHLVSGKVKVYDDDDKLVLADIEADDLKADMTITAKLLNAITGVAPDPKGSETTTVASSTEMPQSSTSSTNQPSSTETQAS